MCICICVSDKYAKESSTGSQKVFRGLIETLKESFKECLTESLKESKKERVKLKAQGSRGASKSI